MKILNGRTNGLKSIEMGLGILLVALTFTVGIASAGSFEWVTVDGNSVPNGGQCNTLSVGSEIIGAYNPNSPWQAILEWKLGSGSIWHNITTYQAMNGRLGFRFIVTDTPTGTDTLNIRAWDTDSWPYGGPFNWYCYQ